MSTEHFDVLVVGAGLSGVGAGYRLSTQCPDKTWAILESRDRIGGTWDLFRYPGIRSDSDMFTLGYPFRPWRKARAIADGASIRTYIEETASEFGIDERIRFGHKVLSADWDSSRSVWTLEVDRGGDGPATFTCSFLYMCSGYYRYDAGYAPDFPGQDRFGGRLVHPQHWPEDLDYAGKRVVVIGSGATAVTLVPSMAGTAAHVTMLQRSPTYIASLPGVDPVAAVANRYLPARLAHQLNRLKSIVLTQVFYQFCQRFPRPAKALIRKMTEIQLPAGYPLDPDFSPRYNPWDQRMCMVPDGDLFKAISHGRASVVTDTVETFTEDGIRLASGQELAADIIVTATGLALQLAGGAAVRVDGTDVDLSSTYVYRGVMLSGLPNFALCVGYTNASWTLRADLSSKYVCRMLNHMDANGYVAATPTGPDGASGNADPFLNLKSGYVQRSIDMMPKQGDRAPWLIRHNYMLDFFTARYSDLTEGMAFTRPGDRPAAGAREAVAAPA